MAQRQATFQSLFQELDKDRSGFIDTTEFETAMQRLGMELSRPELREVLGVLDVNQDGKIEYKELAHTLKQHARATKAAGNRPASPTAPAEGSPGMDAKKAAAKSQLQLELEEMRQKAIAEARAAAVGGD